MRVSEGIWDKTCIVVGVDDSNTNTLSSAIPKTRPRITELHDGVLHPRQASLAGPESTRLYWERSARYGEEDGCWCEGAVFRTSWRVCQLHEIREVAQARTTAGLPVAAEPLSLYRGKESYNTRQCIRLDGAHVFTTKRAKDFKVASRHFQLTAIKTGWASGQGRSKLGRMWMLREGSIAMRCRRHLLEATRTWWRWCLLKVQHNKGHSVD